ncbi:xanthine dehydrogenase family protein molybdopterin-binding subunit [Burkholderia sp. Ac-20353]|uniref:xanthine dehydrogenase family protein molybdopterin-binding subunit n=1 Tax=Burkholderia sp. Ac-20353 TaxID=2703894 RepID=UPI00197BB2FF|nr:xanthine dehydrogenase family protein molybdopterin-binding subunit [Burkholderia sp. Ac-20353]MBN3788847.1 xanthine dehydrogenase family protein molybdopterin-binding subunit [Burkholderia sp. Ac-20353]
MLKRRTFLLGSAGATGMLVIGWAWWRPDDRLDTPEQLETSRVDVPLNGWVMINSDNDVTIVMSKSEMGQGVHTGAAMLLAEELDADWSRVRVVMSPLDTIYKDRENLADGLPFRADDHSLLARSMAALARRGARYAGSMVTGGSTSMIDLWGPMREAGATARVMLCTAAAKLWGVPVAECETKAGMVRHRSGRSATYGELVQLAQHVPRPTQVDLKDPKAYTLVGKRLGRIEVHSKLDGSARFGIDALPDKLLYASITMCPTLGGKALDFDKSKVLSLNGVTGIFRVEPYNGGTGGIAVIADNPFIAMRTLCQLSVTWDPGPAAGVNTADVRTALTRALDGDAGRHVFYTVGDADAVLSHTTPFVAQYDVPYLAHGALEPMNCTVQVDDDSATIWVGTQVPMLARNAVATLLGLDEDKVVVNQQLIGGAFGRRLEVDFITQAAAIARQAKGRPVQTIWSRPQDMTHDFYRPACVARYSGAIDASGRLVAWKGMSASQSISAQAMPRTFGTPSIAAKLLPDATTAEGAFDQPYECANILVQHNTVALPVPVGFWRSVGHSHQAFFVESFIDEMAALARKDPIEFRLDMLKQPAHQRHATVLRALVELSGWRSPFASRDNTGARRARGMAMHESFGSVVAQVAEVRQEGDGFRVTRVYCVIDCGLAVNPNLVEQQMESGIVFGLSAALEQAITIEKGQVVQHYFDAYPLVNMETCPEIVTQVIAGGTEPQGVGEAGTPPIAPAVANALFALTGARHRSLPLVMPRPPQPGDDRWCQSVSTGKPLTSMPSPTYRCSG